jgi:acetyltransferase
VAKVVRESAGSGPRPSVLTSWVGRTSAEAARRLLHEAGVPTYETPEDAISACLHLLGHRRAQELLLEAPPSLPADRAPELQKARATLERALAQGRELLTEPESKAVLAAFGLPVVETRIARDVEEAVRVAGELRYPVALKILSPEVSHKSDVGGVTLDVGDPETLRRAARAMAERLSEQLPEARLEGYTVQRMERRPGACELIVGLATDAVFGPVVLFGHGGTAVEAIGDRAVALPPLNVRLARSLIDRTRVARLLAGFRGRPPADLDALSLALVQIAQIAVDLPEVRELDVNPLLADSRGVLALDARVRLDRTLATGASSAERGARLAIRPYPCELEETIALRGGRRVLLRPIRPEDEPAHHAFQAKLEPEDVRFRFFNLVRKLPHSQMARFTQIDYDREMAFVAVPIEDGTGAARETLGVVRTATDPDNERAEFAIVVRSDQKGQGLGWALLDKMIRYSRARGTRELVGQVLPDNRAMLDLAHQLGFQSRYLPEDGIVEVRLALAR